MKERQELCTYAKTKPDAPKPAPKSTQEVLQELEDRHLIRIAGHLQKTPEGRIKLAELQAKIIKTRDRSAMHARIASGKANPTKEAIKQRKQERLEAERRKAQATKEQNANQGRLGTASTGKKAR